MLKIKEDAPTVNARAIPNPADNTNTFTIHGDLA